MKINSLKNFYFIFKPNRFYKERKKERKKYLISFFTVFFCAKLRPDLFKQKKRSNLRKMDENL